MQRNESAAHFLKGKKRMNIFLVMQKPDNRIRGVFVTRESAKKYIGPQNVKPTIKCECCSQNRPNPLYDPFEEWKNKLYIEEHSVEE